MRSRGLAETGLMQESMARRTARMLLALAFIAAGIIHIKSPHDFVAITPPWVPFPQQVVFLTGLCEIAGGAGLMTPKFRRLAGAMLALYALCVWPANFHHALHNIAIGGIHLSGWYHAPRLAFQPVIIWWALWAGGLIAWPFNASRH